MATLEGTGSAIKHAQQIAGSPTRNQYRYCPLSQRDTIRLLRILPSPDKSEIIRCELFKYSLQASDRASRPYTALSYVWGSDEKSKSIIVNDQALTVLPNLFAALSHLRDPGMPRDIWVDAVCINQADSKEKEVQIQFMAIIYARASRVIVWLGEAQDDSDQALESIRQASHMSGGLSNRELFERAIQQLRTLGRSAAIPGYDGKQIEEGIQMFRLANEHSATLENAEEPTQSAIRQLLQRPWFRRIWVLQEVSAARHVQLMCGSEEIDGHAFCLGLECLNINLDYPIHMVTYLIRRAIFRPRRIMQKSQNISLDILPSLGELVDMYHAHQATIRHDKVYALLGMSSDDPSVAELKPDYSVPWETLMQRLVKYLLGGQASIETWNDKEMAIIKTKGFVLGKVSSVGTHSGGKQDIQIILSKALKQTGNFENGSAGCAVQASAKPIQIGDIVCLLQGTSKPTIIRFRGDHFAIVLIAAGPLNFIRSTDESIGWSDISQTVSHNRDLLLVWDWGIYQASSETLPSNYNTWTPESSQTELDGWFEDAKRMWDMAHILGDLGDSGMAEEQLREATTLYKILSEEFLRTLDSRCSLIPLLFAVTNGHEMVASLLVAKDGVDLDLPDWNGRTPLSWAAGNGYETVVRQLLDTSKVHVDMKDWNGRAPLSWAAENGREAVVRQLLDTGKVQIDAEDVDRQTPLWRAAANGHEAVVRQLLDTGKVNVDKTARHGDILGAERWTSIPILFDVTPLWMAAANGHEAVVRQLLDTGKVNIVATEALTGQTPLSIAAENGHEAVVRLLIDTGKVDVDKAVWGSVYHYEGTPLWLAAANGHEAVVRQLLDTGKVDIHAKGWDRRIPLSMAAAEGRHTVVRQLLDTGKVDVDLQRRDNFGRTPLWLAAAGGHEAVVRQLLATGKVNLEAESSDGDTPLSIALAEGHYGVARQLMDADKIGVHLKG